jgi:integrase
VITQAGLGLRVAELLAPRVQDVDFLRRTVRVEFQTTADGKRRVRPKTPRSRRTLPLPDVVGKALVRRARELVKKTTVEQAVEREVCTLTHSPICNRPHNPSYPGIYPG